MPHLGPTVPDLEPGRPLYRVVAPKKLPLGKSVSGNKRPGLFRVYVPTRDGGELTISTTAGTVEVRDPQGNPAKDASGRTVAPGREVKFEVPFDVFGWYGIVVDGAASYTLSSKFTIRGAAKDADGSPLVPWHFYYFAYTKVHQWGASHPAVKYQIRFGGSAGDWEKTNFWQSEVTRGDAGLDGHGITPEACAEKNRRSGTKYTVENCSWWGHCDAAATASAIFKKVPSASGFEPIDLQWMVTEICMRHFDLRCEFHLGDGTRQHPSNKDKAEAAGGQNVDRDVGRFHAALVRMVKRLEQPLVADFRAFVENPDEEVWNQLLYKFEATVEQAEDDGPGANEEETARCVLVKNRLTANADNEQLARANGDPESDQKGWIRDCHYVICFDGSGNVDVHNPKNNYIYCGWGTQKAAWPVRYLFSIKGLNFGRALGGNPHVRWEQVRTLGVQMHKRYGG